MQRYPEVAWERAMKIQEVILRAVAKKITWWQAAEIIGISDRSLRRWRERHEQYGYDGLFDPSADGPSPQRVPLQTGEEVLRLYQEKDPDFNVRPFHEKLVEEHGIGLSSPPRRKAGLARGGVGEEGAEAGRASQAAAAGAAPGENRDCGASQPLLARAL